MLTLPSARFRLLLLTVIGFLCPRPSHGQGAAISVSAGTHISTDSPNTPFVETFLAINPRNPKNLVSTSMVGADGLISTRIYFSRDGGGTWQRAKTSTDNIGGADPVVYFDSKGTAFFGFSATGRTGFLLSQSNDGGATWEAPSAIPGGVYDRPYLAFDNTGRRFNGRIYAGGTVGITEASGKLHRAVAIAFSTDRGRTFSSPRIVTGDWQGEDADEISDLIVAPDGRLLVCFVGSTQSSGGDSLPSGHFWTLVSEDGGLTFSKAKQGPTLTEGEGQRMLRSGAAPRASMDLSDGKFRGRLYLAWSDFDGKRYTVRVAHSTDLGQTWSPALVVNDNVNDGDPANPAITVAGNGVLGIVFNDRRDDPQNSCFRLYVAASVDGGDSFLPNAQASQKPTCPFAPGNWAASAESWMLPPIMATQKRHPVLSMSAVASRWPNGGDTQGLVASPDNVFHSAWINGETGVMQLWSKEIRLNTYAIARSSTAIRKDLSSELTLRTSDATIDIEKHTVSMKARLFNPLPTAIPGPFALVLDDLGGALKGLRAMNSDNGKSDDGATWNFTVGGDKDNPILQPQQESDERIFFWEFSGGLSQEAMVPLFAHFAILGGPGVGIE